MVGEYELKAAFLYNFAKFIDWPEESHVSRTGMLTLCVLDKTPFGETLSSLEGKRIQGRMFHVASYRSLEDVNRCDILFLNGSKAEQIRGILNSLDDRPILTVGEAEHFTDWGGMINFYLQNDKVRFEISLEPVQQAGLQLSSKLLKLARITTGKAPGDS